MNREETQTQKEPTTCMGFLGVMPFPIPCISGTVFAKSPHPPPLFRPRLCASSAPGTAPGAAALRGAGQRGLRGVPGARLPGGGQRAAGSPGARNSRALGMGTGNTGMALGREDRKGTGAV